MEINKRKSHLNQIKTNQLISEKKSELILDVDSEQESLYIFFK